MTRPRCFSCASVACLALCSVVWADDSRTRLSGVGDAAKYGADIVVVLDETDTTVRPSGIGEARTRRIVKVLRDGGIRGQAVQRISFDPTTNTLDLRRVRVLRADGKDEEVAVSTAVTQPEPQWGIYWGSRQMLIGIPRLDVGDALEIEYVKTGFNVAYLHDAAKGSGTGGAARPAEGVTASLQPPMPGHWYDEVAFHSDVPIIEKRYVVRMPRDKSLQYETYNGEVRVSVLRDAEHVVHTFEKRDIAPFAGEPGMPSRNDLACKLVLATVEDWPTKSRWFHEKNEAGFAANDDLRATVQSVTAGCSDDEARITALNHWVAENIRYIGTSRGACEGYTSHAALETYYDRGGVCKDKAGLLVAMLRVAGFDSFIVMTMAGQDVAPVPADQFNHAVTCIRRKDGTFRLLDPTWMPKSNENWSSAEQEQYVVYGTPNGEPLAKSPASPAAENAAVYTLQSVLADDGALSGTLAFTSRGGPDTSLRRALAGRRPGEREDFVASGFRQFWPETAITELSASDPVDFGGPIKIDASFNIPHAAVGDANRRHVPLLCTRVIWGDQIAGDVLGAPVSESRKLPIRMRTTRRIDIRETIKLPNAWSVGAMPEAIAIDGPAASLKFSCEKSGTSLSYHLEYELRKRTVPAADYAGFKQVHEALNKLRERMVVCQRGEASAGL